MSSLIKNLYTWMNFVWWTCRMSFVGWTFDEKLLILSNRHDTDLQLNYIFLTKYFYFNDFSTLLSFYRSDDSENRNSVGNGTSKNHQKLERKNSKKLQKQVGENKNFVNWLECYGRLSVLWSSGRSHMLALNLDMVVKRTVRAFRN